MPLRPSDVVEMLRLPQSHREFKRYSAEHARASQLPTADVQKKKST